MNVILIFCYGLLLSPVFFKGGHMLRRPRAERSVLGAVGVLFAGVLAFGYLSVMTCLDLLF